MLLYIPVSEAQCDTDDYKKYDLGKNYNVLSIITIVRHTKWTKNHDLPRHIKIWKSSLRDVAVSVHAAHAVESLCDL